MNSRGLQRVHFRQRYLYTELILKKAWMSIEKYLLIIRGIPSHFLLIKKEHNTYMTDEAVRKYYKMKIISSLLKEENVSQTRDTSCIWKNNANMFYRKHDMPIYTLARFKNYEFGVRKSVVFPTDIYGNVSEVSFEKSLMYPYRYSIDKEGATIYHYTKLDYNDAVSLLKKLDIKLFYNGRRL